MTVTQAQSPSHALVAGVLLYGPPGTGKTLLARHIGALLGCNLVTLSIPQVIRGEIGKGEEAVRARVREAQRLAPSVLFVDEFQAIFTQRGTGAGAGGEEGTGVGQTLSSALAGAFDTINIWNRHAGANNAILVLGATNEPWAVDRGFLRRGRFDQALFVGPLSQAGRREFLSVAMEPLLAPAEAEAGAGAGVVEEVVARTHLYSGADLHLVLRRASWRASTTDTASIAEPPSSSSSATVTREHVLWALEQGEPTSSQGDVDEYLRWAESMKL